MAQRRAELFADDGRGYVKNSTCGSYPIACHRVERPDEYHGIKQQPFTGVSMNYSFNKADAANAKKIQY